MFDQLGKVTQIHGKRNMSRQQYEFLRKHVPKNKDSMLSTISNNVICLGKEAIRKQRIITLYPFFRRKSTNAWHSKLFHPLESDCFYGISQISQNSSFLLLAIYDHPEPFARLLVSHAESPSFDTIVSSTLPQIFGFFACSEQLINAKAFYLNIIKIAPPHIATQFLVPFFNNGSTFRFIEYAMTHFTNAFTGDYVVCRSENRNTLPPIYGPFLVDCVKDALKLLPQQHLDVLQCCKAVNWPMREFGNLFMNKFIWPNVFSWISASPAKSARDLMVTMFNNIPRDKILDLYRAVFTSTSIYDPPQLFNAFETPYHSVFVNVGEMAHIARVMEAKAALPRAMLAQEFMPIEKSDIDCWFWCQVYPRSRKNQSLLEDSIIFDVSIPVELDVAKMTRFRAFESMAPPDSDCIDFALSKFVAGGDEPFGLEAACYELTRFASDFEKLLEQDMQKGRLEDWLRILEDDETMIITSSLEEMVQKNSMEIIQRPEGFFKKTATFFPTAPLVRKLWLLMVELNGGEYVNPHSRKLHEIETSFKEIMKARITFAEVVEGLCPSHKQAVWESVKLLRCSELVVFSRKFDLMVTAYTRVMIIGQATGLSEQLFQAICEQVPERVTVTAFLIFNSLTMRDDNFTRLLSDPQNMAWRKMESALLKIVKDKEALLLSIIQVQDALWNTMAEVTALHRTREKEAGKSIFRRIFQ